MLRVRNIQHLLFTLRCGMSLRLLRLRKLGHRDFAKGDATVRQALLSLDGYLVGYYHEIHELARMAGLILMVVVENFVGMLPVKRPALQFDDEPPAVTILEQQVEHVGADMVLPRYEF